MSILKKFTRLINMRDDEQSQQQSVVADILYSPELNKTVSSDTAMRISTVYSCIRVRAESL